MQCSVFKNITLISGLLDPNECYKSECKDTQTPVTDGCYPKDGYKRYFLNRSWNTSCPALNPDYYKTFTYPWDYHGSWYFDSTATLRCLPGFTIPSAYSGVSITLLKNNSMFFHNIRNNDDVGPQLSTLWVQTTFKLLWFYSVPSKTFVECYTHQTTFISQYSVVGSNHKITSNNFY